MKSKEKVDNIIENFRFEPIEIFTEWWRITDNENMTEWVKKQPQWVQINNETWKYADPSSGYHELSYNKSTQTLATLTKYRKGLDRYLIYFGLLILPISILSPSIIWAILLFVSIKGAFPNLPSPLINAPTIRVKRQTNLIPVVLIFGGMFCISRVMAGFLPSLIGTLMIVSVLLFTSIWVYSINGFPTQTTHSYVEILRIPLHLLISGAMSLALIFGGYIGSTWIIHYLTGWRQMVVENPQTVASRLAELSGGSINSETFLIGILDTSLTWLPLGVLFAVVFYAFLINIAGIKDGSKLYTELSQIAVPQWISTKDQLVIAAIYTLSIGVAICLYLFAGGVIWYGITGTLVLPTSIITPIAPYLPPETAQSGLGILESFYHLFAERLSIFNLPESNLSVVGVLMIVFLPILVLSGAMCVGLANIIKRQLFNQTPKSHGEKQSISTILNTLNSKQGLKKYAIIARFVPGGQHLNQVLDPQNGQYKEVKFSEDGGWFDFFWRVVALYYGRPALTITDNEDTS